jgi:serine palmitoyltransferase
LFLKQESRSNCFNLKRSSQESFEEAPLWAAIVTYIGYGILNIFGWIRDFLRAIGLEKNTGAKDSNPPVNFALFLNIYKAFFFINFFLAQQNSVYKGLCSIILRI